MAQHGCERLQNETYLMRTGQPISLILDTTSPRARKWYWRIVRFPLARLILAAFMVMLAASGPFVLILLAFDQPVGNASDGIMLLAVSAAVIGGVLAYWLYVRLIEWRGLDELAMSGALKETGLGVIVGVGLIAAVIGVIALTGGYRITGMNPPSAMVGAFSIAVMSGCVEEIVARGVIFRIVEESMGTWISTLISAALFGLLHANNPNATTFSSIAIAVSAGPLLAGAYVLTRRLWLCMGIHFGWNFALAGIFGAAMSGNDMEGLLECELSGPEWISGGAFGPEASVVTITMCIALSVVFYVLAAKRGLIVKAFWNRRGGKWRR